MESFVLTENNIMHEDNHIIVVVKPQNVPSQEDSTGDKDMLSAVKEYLKTKYEKPGNAFCGLVHRLDRPTGGVMVFAKTSKAAARLADSIKSDEFDKTYLAVTEGVPKEKTGRLIHYLMKNEEKNTVYTVPQSTVGAKYAELTYKLRFTNEKHALLEVKLATGRSHQIRVQLASIGIPICGDYRYGRVAKASELALWAAELKFPHPVTDKTMVFRAYPPDIGPWNEFDINQIMNIARITP